MGISVSIQDNDTSEAGPNGGAAARTGFWHVFESGQVVAMKWNPVDEEMDLETDQEQLARYKAGIQDFDPFLGAYPLMPPESTYPAWLNLSNHIKTETLKRLFKGDGSFGFVNSHDDQLQEELARAEVSIRREQDAEKKKKQEEEDERKRNQIGTIQEEDEGEMDDKVMEVDSSESVKPVPKKSAIVQGPGAVVKKDVKIYFTEFNLRQSFRKGAVGEEVTKYSQDKSWLLNHLFTTEFGSDADQFLGEYQVAFVTMLLGQHLDAFRQWKQMTLLVCQSQEAAWSPNYTALFGGFIVALQRQLSSIPSTFFMDLLFASPDQGDMTANFLELSLSALSKTIQNGLKRGLALKLRVPFRGLQKTVWESFEWKIGGQFDKVQPVTILDDDVGDDSDYEEEGEYAPVIVE